MVAKYLMSVSGCIVTPAPWNACVQLGIKRERSSHNTINIHTSASLAIAERAASAVGVAAVKRPRRRPTKNKPSEPCLIIKNLKVYDQSRDRCDRGTARPPATQSCSALAEALAGGGPCKELLCFGSIDRLIAARRSEHDILLAQIDPGRRFSL